VCALLQLWSAISQAWPCDPFGGSSSGAADRAILFGQVPLAETVRPAAKLAMEALHTWQLSIFRPDSSGCYNMVAGSSKPGTSGSSVLLRSCNSCGAATSVLGMLHGVCKRVCCTALCAQLMRWQQQFQWT
jgi:hypothetical protein